MWRSRNGLCPRRVNPSTSRRRQRLDYAHFDLELSHAVRAFCESLDIALAVGLGNSLHDLATIGAAQPPRSRQARRDQSCFPVRQFACIPYCASGILQTREISPAYCGLRASYANKQTHNWMISLNSLPLGSHDGRYAVDYI